MPQASRSTLSTLSLAIAIGLLWLAIELLVAVAALPGVSVPELGARMVALAPWHLAIFAGWGLGIALVLRGRAGVAMRAWCVIGGASFTFLGARIVEGLMRRGGPSAAAIGALAAALGVTLAIALFAAPALLFARAHRMRWHAAAAVAWVALFVIFLERAGYEIGRARGDLAAWLAHFGARDLLLLGLPIGTGLLVAARTRALYGVVGAALLLLPLQNVFGGRGGERAPRATPPPGTPDVIVLVLDTFRGDHLGLVVDGASITPQLDRLAAQSVVFSHAFAPSNWTRGSMPGLLASQPYSVVGNAPSQSMPTFASELQRAGFHTVGASANPLVSDRLGWGHGYDELVDPNTMGDPLVAHPLQMIGAAATAPAYRIGAATNAVYFRDATEMRRRAVELLDRAPQPAFLHLQTMDTHGPYLPPHRWLPPGFDFSAVYSYYRFMGLRGRGKIGEAAFRPELENFRQRYAASVRHVDAEIGALLDELRRRGRFDEALIWVVSDHGEAFGEHDVAGHTGLALGNELVRVPFLVKAPKSWGFAPRVEPGPVSTFSMLPTTLALLGLPPLPVAFGADLSGLLRGDEAARPETPVVVESASQGTYIHAAIRWPWKLVAVTRKDGTRSIEGLYDLSAGFDDAHSRVDGESERIAALLADIDAYRARVGELAAKAKDAGEIDATTEEQLRRLGYVQ